MNPTCKRCGGKGSVTYQYGKAGTDRHAPYSEVEWGEATVKPCPVCLGTGFGKVSKYADTTTGMHITFDMFGAPHRTPLSKEKQDELDEREDTGTTQPGDVDWP